MKLFSPFFLLTPLIGCAALVPGEDPTSPDGAPIDQEPDDTDDPGIDDEPDVDDEPDAPQPECRSDDDCDNGETCWVNPVALWSRCVQACETDDDCEGDKRCRTMYDARACVDPLDGEEVPPPPVDDGDGLPVTPGDVTCFGPFDDELIELTFSLDADTTSAMVVPFAVDGGPLVPRTITVPDGQTFSLEAGGGSFLGVTAGLIGFTAPLFLPQFPAAEVLLQPGDYTYTVSATTDELCTYTVTETAAVEGTIDLNLYYVGVDGLTAATAPTDPDLQDALAFFEVIFEGADISLGQVRHFDVAPDVASEFAVIEDVQTEPGPLVATSLPPGDDDDALLSVNVFLVAEMADGNVIGISQGIPGPAGLHGTPGSGVVLTAELLGNALGNQQTGQVLAHELGHWLGLFHTSEIQGGFFDPLDDTAQCGTIAQLVDVGAANQCPDFFNLMFPFVNANGVDVSGEQRDVLIANPVTR